MLNREVTTIRSGGMTVPQLQHECGRRGVYVSEWASHMMRRPEFTTAKQTSFIKTPILNPFDEFSIFCCARSEDGLDIEFRGATEKGAIGWGPEDEIVVRLTAPELC